MKAHPTNAKTIYLPLSTRFRWLEMNADALVSDYRAARLFGGKKRKKAHMCNCAMGWALLHPQQQLSANCRALTADLLSTKTLRCSPCSMAHQGTCSTPREPAVSACSGHEWFILDRCFLMYLCRVGLTNRRNIPWEMSCWGHSPPPRLCLPWNLLGLATAGADANQNRCK